MVALGLASDPPPLPGPSTFLAPPNFRPIAREVDNWRREGALALDLTPDAMFAFAGEDLPRGVTRCVKLNNYWCIKRAGWAGEIAADAEGHVAFASAREGAAVAALLLRRYYMDYGLHTAHAIISRWAPAQCGLVARSGGGGVIVRSASLGTLTTRGLGNTLRARWLAGHTRAGFAKAGPVAAPRKGSKSRVAVVTPRRSVVPDLVGPLLDTPNIMVGPGAPSRQPVRLAMLPYPGVAMGPANGAGRPLPALPPLMSCGGDSVRIANYAAKAADGIGSPDIDLALFDKDGMPTANLAKVMTNMAAVEIGPLKASDELVAAGVAAVAARRQ